MYVYTIWGSHLFFPPISVLHVCVGMCRVVVYLYLWCLYGYAYVILHRFYILFICACIQWTLESHISYIQLTSKDHEPLCSRDSDSRRRDLATI